MPKTNTLILFSDEHRSDAMGCAGHKLVKTPNLDWLAQQGTRFTQAYTPSPVCVPARAALACGEYVHKTRCWSNSQAYQGDPPSFGHVLQTHQHPVTSIGKLHYRGKEYNNGFDQELLPLYIPNGLGWIRGLLRDHESILDCSHYAQDIGPGNNRYTDYDLAVTKQACKWINQHSQTMNSHTKPWTLFVSWLRPHYPLTCPDAFFNLYPLDKMDSARFREKDQRPQHPVSKILRKNFNYDDFFNEESRQIARASYYGLCSFLDAQVGKVLATLSASGQLDNTLIIYTSDHGDHNGDREFWTKMTLYDESSRIPLIVAGPEIPKSKTVRTNASLVDIYPSVLSAAGIGYDDKDKPGIALQTLANQETTARTVLSEYHDGGSPTGLFMLRNERWKYNYYPGYQPELFDMKNDPDELTDLSSKPAYKNVIKTCHNQMLGLVDPEKENQQALTDQAEKIESLGGIASILNAHDFDFTPVEGITEHNDLSNTK